MSTETHASPLEEYHDNTDYDSDINGGEEGQSQQVQGTGGTSSGIKPLPRLQPAPHRPVSPPRPGLASNPQVPRTERPQRQQRQQRQRQQTSGVEQGRDGGGGFVFQRQGVQGPFGRFRGESLSICSEINPSDVSKLFQNIRLEAMMIENWVQKRLVLVGHQQPLDKALQRLNRHKITSIPIISEQTGKILGIVDSLDIVIYLSQVLEHESIIGTARWNFSLETTVQLLENSKKKAMVISNHASMYDGLKALAKVPRLMVVDQECELHEQTQEETGILGLFTQSDVIRFLATNPYWLNLSPVSQKTLNELNILDEARERVVTIEQNTPAYLAFKKIAETGVPGIAVVDIEGRIVANISASNIRGISRRNFQLLRRPLYEFLQRDRRRGWWSMPITFRKTDTVEKMVLQFCATKVHQIYVLDEGGKPEACITLADIINRLI